MRQIESLFSAVKQLQMQLTTEFLSGFDKYWSFFA